MPNPQLYQNLVDSPFPRHLHPPKIIDNEDDEQRKKFPADNTNGKNDIHINVTVFTSMISPL